MWKHIEVFMVGILLARICKEQRTGVVNCRRKEDINQATVTFVTESTDLGWESNPFYDPYEMARWDFNDTIEDLMQFTKE